MKIPILETGDTIKRYHYAQLVLPFAHDPVSLPQYCQFMQNPDPFVVRSILEWSAYFGFDVQVIEDQEPACIGWERIRND